MRSEPPKRRPSTKARSRDMRIRMTPEQKKREAASRAKWRAGHPEVVRKAQIKYRHSEKYKAYRRAYDKKRLAQNADARDALVKYRLRRLKLKKFLSTSLPADVKEEQELRVRAMRIRTMVRRFFRALDAADDPTEYLRQQKLIRDEA